MDKTQTMDRRVSDLLTMFDDGHKNKRGFLTRICYYCFVAAKNDMNAQYPTLKQLQDKVLSGEKVHDAIQATLLHRENSLASPDHLEPQLERNSAEEEDLEAKASHFAHEMIGTVTSRVIRFCGWIYLTLLKQVCSSVQFHPAQIQSIQEVAHSGVPLIYMPLHFSHLDYILVSLILFHNQIRVPYIASGNNLYIPLFGYFIKRAGGFFIRRKLDGSNQKDFIYRAVLQTYIIELLKNGQSIEIFLEGTRSRSGLPNTPKTGLLSLLADAVVEGQIQDALLVPVSISYEKLFEGNFNDELMGKPKTKENLWNTLKSIVKMLCGTYGSIKINFGKPTSLKAALHDICMYSSCKSLTFESLASSMTRPVNNNFSYSPPSVSPSPCSLDSFESTQNDVSWRKNISLLAEHIVFNGLKCRSFMSVHLLAFLLVNKWRNGVYLSDLVATFTQLRKEITCRGRDVGFSGKGHDVVLHALNLLGHKVITLEYITGSTKLPGKKPTSKQITGAGDAPIMPTSLSMDELDKWKQKPNGFHFKLDDEKVVESKPKYGNGIKPKVESPTLYIKPLLSIPNIFELTYYANSLTPLFALESILCLSVTAVTGFRFSTIREQWNRNNGIGIFEDNLPEKMCLSFLKSTLLEKALELTDFMQVDLILCDVVSDLEETVKDTLHDLIMSGVFLSETYGNCKKTHIAFGLDEEDNVSGDQWLKVNPLSISQLLCYQSVLAPMVEGLALVSEQLKVLDDPMPQKQFLSRVLDQACNRSLEGVATRVECCSRDILAHSINAFKSNNVIEINDGNLKLCQEFANSDHLDLLLAKICAYMM